MEYFWMRQREDLRYHVSFKNVFKTIDKRSINSKRAQQLPKKLFFEITTSDNAVFADILDRDLFLASQTLMELFDIYMPQHPHIPTVLVDPKRDIAKRYYIPLFRENPCLLKKARLDLNGKVTEAMVLNVDTIGDDPIFRVELDVQPIVVARLDFAESVLRRDLIGIAFEQVKLSKKI